MPIEIDADAGLWIATDGAGNQEQFADAICEVWESISQGDRDVMTAYWAEGTPIQDASPVVSLVADYFLPGNNDNFGHMLTFNSSAAGLFSEAGLLHGLIAHELGHIYRFATGSPAPRTIHPLEQAKEYEADVKAEEWGYVMTAMREWTTEHVEAMDDCGVHVSGDGTWDSVETGAAASPNRRAAARCCAGRGACSRLPRCWRSWPARCICGIPLTQDWVFPLAV